MTPLDRFIQRYRVRVAGRFLPPPRRVLDVGTADGALYRLLPGLTGVGIDPDLTPGPAPDGVTLVRGRFPDDVPAGEPFDAVTLLAVLEHVPPAEQPPLAAACASVLKPGGTLVVTVPSAAADGVLAALRGLRLIDGMSLEQHYGFRAGTTPDVFRPAGFELVRHRRFQLGLNNLFVFRRAAGRTP